MSRNLAAGKTFEVVEQLRSTVDSFASRAEKLEADYKAERISRKEYEARKKQIEAGSIKTGLEEIMLVRIAS